MGHSTVAGNKSEDEIACLTFLVNTIGVINSDFFVGCLGIPCRKVYRFLEKWDRLGWIEYGCTIWCPWVTEEGKLSIRRFIESKGNLLGFNKDYWKERYLSHHRIRGKWTPEAEAELEGYKDPTTI